MLSLRSLYSKNKEKQTFYLKKELKVFKYPPYILKTQGEKRDISFIFFNQADLEESKQTKKLSFTKTQKTREKTNTREINIDLMLFSNLNLKKYLYS